ncbi:MAG TPA: hypothetical protein VLH61_02570, partial [Bacteroidales bacterium]|nr:hypothetical protein [Bacteroidales bacterium]
MKTSNYKFVAISGLLIFFSLLIIAPGLQAQYFGRNKPAYRRFDFKVYESPNFEIFHYFENDSV